MNTYEIRITNENDSSDFATTAYISQEPDKTTAELIELVEKAINYQNDLEFTTNNTFFTISAAGDDEGYMYNMYESQDAYENGADAIDGGQCTGTINDALTMALN
jgi:hypothetical protein